MDGWAVSPSAQQRLGAPAKRRGQPPPPHTPLLESAAATIYILHRYRHAPRSGGPPFAVAPAPGADAGGALKPEPTIETATEIPSRAQEPQSRLLNGGTHPRRRWICMCSHPAARLATVAHGAASQAATYRPGTGHRSETTPGPEHRPSAARKAATSCCWRGRAGWAFRGATVRRLLSVLAPDPLTTSGQRWPAGRGRASVRALVGRGGRRCGRGPLYIPTRRCRWRGVWSSLWLGESGLRQGGG